MPNEKYYIDRVPIMQFIVDGLNERDPMKNLGYDGIRILTELEFAPKADVVEVVHGRWIVKGQEVFCSHCDKESGYNYWGASAFSDYCPNCGAKMEIRVVRGTIKENKE